MVYDSLWSDTSALVILYDMLLSHHNKSANNRYRPHVTDLQGPPSERTQIVTDLQGPPSGRTQSDKIRDLKSLAKQYARDQGSCDDTRISYLEYVESEAEADWTLARMIAG
jgi:hypothetical protein